MAADGMTTTKRPCPRCRSKVSPHRLKLVEIQLLNGLTDRKNVCPSCIKEIDDFVNGWEL